MTLTIELPEKLIEQLHDRQVSDEELKAVVIAVLEIWLGDRRTSAHGGRFNETAVPFIQKLIIENRELFEALAQR